jgi:glycine/D-amino acid oxidase-like deaminating enzyme
MTYDVAVIGAGILGASTAYHLMAEKPGKVLLIDRAGSAAGGTGKSAAIVRQHYSTRLASRLTKDSIEMFVRMPDELGASGGFVGSGWRMLVPDSMLAAARANVAMQRSIGVRTSMVEGSGAADGLAWLDPEGIAAVVHEPDGGYADPVQTTEAYIKAFEREGGTFRPKTPVRALLGERERVTGILTDDGTLSVGTVVNAAGPWAAPLAASVGLDLPIRVVREQDTVWQARAGRPLPEGSVSNAVEAIYLRPLGDGRYIVGRGFPKTYHDVDPYNFKETADEDFVDDVRSRLERRFPPMMQGAALLDSYGALYDVTPDWYPVIGPRAGVHGYADASGGSGHAFKLGPAIGRELAAWLLRGEVGDDFRQLSNDRFAAGKPFVQSYGGNRG